MAQASGWGGGTILSARGLRLLGLATLTLGALTACSVLPQPKPTNLSRYQLEYHAAPGPVTANPAGPVLLVAVPQVAAAFNTSRMAYVTRRYGIQYFARSQWVDTPANMLAPLMVSALESSGRFGAVMRQPATMPVRLRLDTMLIRLQQDFTVQPSRVELTLRARLTDLAGQRVLATRVFAVSQPAAKDDPYGGVAAANEAVQTLLKELTRFCVVHAQERGR
ncbi:MAG: ABC-type transport auxiliary lipoprotein family protein [Gammaproteobacteria bacterium]